METVTLVRRKTGDSGTFGDITYRGTTFYTGELSWHNGDDAPDSSCIPEGSYVCSVSYSPHLSPLFGMNLYLLQGVKNRSSIRIHPANWMGDHTKGLKCQLEGCIALGKSLGPLGGQDAVIESRIAVATFMKMLNNQDFTLVIQNAFTPAVEAPVDACA